MNYKQIKSEEGNELSHYVGINSYMDRNGKPVRTSFKFFSREELDKHETENGPLTLIFRHNKNGHVITLR